MLQSYKRMGVLQGPTNLYLACAHLSLCLTCRAKRGLTTTGWTNPSTEPCETLLILRIRLQRGAGVPENNLHHLELSEPQYQDYGPKGTPVWLRPFALWATNNIPIGTGKDLQWLRRISGWSRVITRGVAHTSFGRFRLRKTS